MVRNGKLNMLVFMRSNDAIFGAGYDLNIFFHIQAIMASKLGIEVGKYTHIADSFHIYEQHFELAQQLIDNPAPTLYSEVPITNLIPSDQIDVELARVQNIEVLTRRIGNIVDLKKVENLLNGIQSDYWRSLATVVAIYNIRKAKRSQKDVDYLKSLVVNEFKTLVQDWQTLKKD